MGISSTGELPEISDELLAPLYAGTIGTPEIEQTLSQFLVCHHAGCMYSVRFQIGQRDWAEQTRAAHELHCSFRFLYR